MPKCDRCGVEASSVTKFCANCGARFVARPESVGVEGDPGAYYCFKHKREITRVTCGRCEKPICPKCLIVGPAGVRCKACASNKVPVSVTGMLHDAKSRVGPIDGRKVWYLYLLSMIVRFFTGWFR